MPLLAGIQLHYHTEIRFDPLGHFTAISGMADVSALDYDEAWDTHQEKRQLIQRLESIANQVLNQNR